MSEINITSTDYISSTDANFEFFGWWAADGFTSTIKFNLIHPGPSNVAEKVINKITFDVNLTAPDGGPWSISASALIDGTPKSFVVTPNSITTEIATCELSAINNIYENINSFTIEISGSGSYSNSITSSINVTIGEPETPGGSHLYKHTGRTETITIIDDPVPDIIDPSPPDQTNPLTPNPNTWGSKPISNPQNTLIPNPNNIEPIAPITTFNRVVMVPCTTIDGDPGHSLWRIDDQGQLLSQIQPCIKG